jgi:mono/diheme cytochrome c family protein
MLAPAAAAALLALAGSGCGTSESDTVKGRELFIQKCGSCHTLAQAQTTGQQGPDLDAAFGPARQAGQDRDTIQGVVEAQIAFPRPTGNYPENPAITMPADLVKGQDAIDVAAYVGEVAGNPAAKPPQIAGGPGAQVFASNGCAGCHTLAAAKAGGTTGPNLDETLPGQTAQEITSDITTPQAEIVKGFPNVMPGNYEQLIPPDKLKQLVAYLISSTSGAGGGSGGGGN